MILEKSINACEGETLVKSYLCTEFNSTFFGLKAKGYIEVTNKRLLFQALGSSVKGMSVLHSEIAISEVSGINIYKGTSFSLLRMIIGIVAAGAGAALTSKIFGSMINNSVASILALAVLVYVLYRAYLWAKINTFSIVISSKGAGGTVVSIAGLSPFGASSSTASKALSAAPGADSELLLKEIGAVILDIQNLGDYGIEKWKGKS